MNENKHKISLNFTSILLGKGAGLVINLFSVILAARYLGVKNYGIFAAILSVVNILTKFIDFGFSPIVTRETAKDLKNFTFVNNAISIRIILFLILIVFSNFFFYLIKLPTNEIIYSNILFANIILSSRVLSFRELFEIPFKVSLKMHIVSILNFIDNFLLLILILFIPFFKNKLLYFVTIFSLANLPGFIALLFFLKKEFNYKFHFNLNKAKWLLTQSFPLMGYVLLLVFFQQFDVVLTKNLISDSASGIYAAGIRLNQPFNIFSIAIVSTTIPLIISSLQRKEKNTKFLITYVYKLLLAISFVTAVIFSFKAEEIILLLFGKEYEASAKILTILAWSNIFLFFNYYTVEVLTVFSLQRYNFLFAFIMVITDLTLFLLFYKQYGVVAAATARTIATLVGAIYLKIIQRKIYKKITILNFRTLVVYLLLAGLGFAMLKLNLFIYIILYILLSIPVILFAKVFSKYEIDILFKIFKINKYFPKIEKLIQKIYS